MPDLKLSLENYTSYDQYSNQNGMPVLNGVPEEKDGAFYVTAKKQKREWVSNHCLLNQISG